MTWTREDVLFEATACDNERGFDTAAKMLRAYADLLERVERVHAYADDLIFKNQGAVMEIQAILRGDR